MPLHWTISHPHRLVIAIVKGQCRRADVEQYFAGVGAEGAQAYRKIFDVTKAESPLLTEDDISSLAAQVRELGERESLGPIAIVAPNAESHALAELFAAKATAKRPISVFRELHEARRWLDGFHLTAST
jgi:hypothetical protein